MTKLKKLQPKVKDLPKKKNDQGAVGKVVKKKAATLTQKKKETIVQNIISKKDELVDKAALKKGKNIVKPNLKEEKQKSTYEKKSKAAPKVVPAPKKISAPKVVPASKKISAPKEEKPEPPVVSKRGKNKEKPAVALKEKKTKAAVIAKKPSVVVPKEDKSKSKVLAKNKNKSKQISVPEEKEEVISKVLTKKEKSNLKKVLVPREDKNVTEVVSKKNKNKAKVIEPAKEEQVESEPISKRAKRKIVSVLQKENTVPEVASKKAKVTKNLNKKAKTVAVEEPVLEKVGKATKKQNLGKDSLKRKSLENYVEALLKVVDTGEQKRRTLLDTEKPPIFLMITSVKVPKAPLHQIRLDLPHSLVGSNDDIGLFVKDLKRGRRIGPDATIQHYEDLMEKHKIKKIKTIIPINQVKTDYRQFEMRRRLLNSCDHFLCDGRISGHLAHLLGKAFRQGRKLPTSVHMDKKDLKEEFDRALNKTSLQIHSTGDTYVTQFATCSMSLDQITDNLLSITQGLSKSFPGGWDNIRSLRIKSPLSLAIPIYMTLKNKNDVKTPVVQPKRPKAYKSVEGELSTFTNNVRVTVAPDGTVDVLNLGGSDDEENPEDVENEPEEAPEKEIKGEEDKDEDEDEEEDKEDDDEDESDG